MFLSLYTDFFFLSAKVAIIHRKMWKKSREENLAKSSYNLVTTQEELAESNYKSSYNQTN